MKQKKHGPEVSKLNSASAATLGVQEVDQVRQAICVHHTPPWVCLTL